MKLTVYKHVNRNIIKLLIFASITMLSCNNTKSDSLSGDWRIASITREALQGGRADHIQLPDHLPANVFIRLEQNGSFFAENAHGKITGSWCAETSPDYVLLKQEEKTDTLYKRTLGGVMHLRLNMRLADGIISIDYKKE